MEFIQQYGGFIFLAVFQVALEAFKARTRRTDANTKQTETATALVMKFNDDRNLLIEKQVQDLSTKHAYAEGQREQAEKSLAAQVVKAEVQAQRTLDKEHDNQVEIQQMKSEIKDLKTTRDTDLTRISTLESENKDLKARLEDLNKTITTRDETIAGLEKRLTELYDKVIGKQVPATPQTAPVTTSGAIPMELTATGTITAIPSDKPPSDTG